MNRYKQQAKVLVTRCQALFDRAKSYSAKFYTARCQSLIDRAKSYTTRCRPLFDRVKSYTAQSPRLSRFIEGPSRLITARFNQRNAVFMVALSIPALLVTALLTLPELLFNTPQHNEYYEFAKQLNHSGDRWVAMGLSACCSFFCFAIPCYECPTEESAEDQ